MSIDKTGKTLVEYNVRNGQYKTAGGTISPLTWLTKVSLEKALSTQEIYGDGELQLTLVKDSGFTGILGMTARDKEFEIANGMQMEVDGGHADVQIDAMPENSIYFETDFAGKDGIVKSKKVWLYGVEVGTPGEALDQSTDTPNINNAEYPITVKGEYLKATGGTADYVDSTTGKKKKVFKLSATPTDSGYAAFGDSVPVPTVKSGG